MRDNQSELGNRLKIARKSKNLNQYDVCRNVGIDQSTYSKLENGKYDLQLSTLFSLSEYLEVNVSWLLGLDNDNLFTNKELLEIDDFKNYIISRRK